MFFDALPVPDPPSTFGVGTTFSIGSDGYADFLSELGYMASDYGYYGPLLDPQATLPSLDLYFGRSFQLRFHPLELVEYMALAQAVDVMVDVNGRVGHVPVGTWEGEAWLGARLGTVFVEEDLAYGVATQGRFGAQTGRRVHVGAFIQPGLGVFVYDGELYPYVDGQLQLSVWFAG